MTDKKPVFVDPLQQRQRSLSRWDNEGGAGPRGPQVPGDMQSEVVVSQFRGTLRTVTLGGRNEAP